MFVLSWEKSTIGSLQKFPSPSILSLKQTMLLVFEKKAMKSLVTASNPENDNWKLVDDRYKISFYGGKLLSGSMIQALSCWYLALK